MSALILSGLMSVAISEQAKESSLQLRLAERGAGLAPQALLGLFDIHQGPYTRLVG